MKIFWFCKFYCTFYCTCVDFTCTVSKVLIILLGKIISDVLILILIDFKRLAVSLGFDIINWILHDNDMMSLIAGLQQYI